MRRRRVAGDDDSLHSFTREKAGDLAAVAPHRLRALWAIGYARRVTEVDDAFTRELAHDLVSDGKSADAGIKNADWRGVCHHQLNDATTAGPYGVVLTES